MIQNFILFVCLVFHVQIASAADWKHLKNEGVGIHVQFMNHNFKELIGAPEFVTSAVFKPYDINNKPLPVFIELEFASRIPKTVDIGKSFYFSDFIPVRYFFDDHSLDMSRVAYFIVDYKVIEDDFFLQQTVLSMKVKLTPNGFSVNKKAAINNVLEINLKTSPGKSVQATAQFSID